MGEERSGNGTQWEKRGAGMEHTGRREEREWTHWEKRGAGMEHTGREENSGNGNH